MTDSARVGTARQRQKKPCEENEQLIRESKRKHKNKSENKRKPKMLKRKKQQQPEISKKRTKTKTLKEAETSDILKPKAKSEARGLKKAGRNCRN